MVFNSTASSMTQPSPFSTPTYTSNELVKIESPLLPTTSNMRSQYYLIHPVYTGNIVNLSTTPPSITIVPDFSGTSVTATGFSPIQLENLLKGMSLGATHVTYTLRLTPFGLHAENVHSTGYVDERRWREYDKHD